MSPNQDAQRDAAKAEAWEKWWEEQPEQDVIETFGMTNDLVEAMNRAHDAWDAAWAACAARVRDQVLAEVEAVARKWADDAQMAWQTNPLTLGLEERAQMDTLQANGVLRARGIVRAAEEAAHGT